MKNLKDLYPGRFDLSDLTGYPFGKSKIRTAVGNGTPWLPGVGDNTFGFHAALLDEGGVSISDTDEKVGQSDLVDAIKAIINTAVSTAIDGITTNTSVFQHRLSSGVDAGSASVGWNVRTFNYTEHNDITGVLLSANQITLPIGNYILNAFSTAHRVAGHLMRIKSVSGDAFTDIIGSIEYSGSGSAYANGSSLIEGIKLTISTETVIGIDHYATIAKSTDGLGNGAASGSDNIFAQIMITEVN